MENLLFLGVPILKHIRVCKIFNISLTEPWKLQKLFPAVKMAEKHEGLGVKSV